jgi:predicted Zn-dependent peptidase
MQKQRKWKFIHGDSDNQEVKEHIETKYGVRKSKFDELPGWFAPLALPPEVMHLFFGGGEQRGILAIGFSDPHKVHPIKSTRQS